MSQHNQSQTPYQYGAQQQQQQSLQSMTPEQQAAYQAHIAARYGGAVPGHAVPTASGYAGYAQGAQAYPVQHPGATPYPQAGGQYAQYAGQQPPAGHYAAAQHPQQQQQGQGRQYAAYPPPPLTVAVATPTEDRPFPCDYCSRTFARMHDLRRHAEAHTGDKPHACSYPGCKCAYSRKDALKRHQDTSGHHV